MCGGQPCCTISRNMQIILCGNDFLSDKNINSINDIKDVRYKGK
jgi:hypothetical protein